MRCYDDILWISSGEKAKKRMCIGVPIATAQSLKRAQSAFFGGTILLVPTFHWQAELLMRASMSLKAVPAVWVNNGIGPGFSVKVTRFNSRLC